MSIAAASVVAKTYRDDYMDLIHEEFPMYNWKQNKGYPTKEHRAAIKKYGPCKYHRMTFKLLEDYAAQSQTTAKDVSLENLDMVFVGYGINAPEFGWNDYEGIDWKGKTAVVLINDPGFKSGDSTITLIKSSVPDGLINTRLSLPNKFCLSLINF
mgnify:CR=1 FL=1